MPKRYESVLEMVKDIGTSEELRAQLEREIQERELAKKLFAMRCAKGLTQKEMAERIGCTQGRVSKLEHAGLEGIRVSDLVAYAMALDLHLSISFHEDRTAVDSVKWHVFEIKKHLDHLAELAHRDDGIFEGVKDFYGEYLFNVLRLFEQSAHKLPKEEKETPTLEVCAPTDVQGEGQEQFVAATDTKRTYAEST